MEQTRITRVSDYIRFIEQISANYQNPLKLLYRGESSAEYDLLPSVYRKRITDKLSNPETGEIKPIMNYFYLTQGSEADLIQDFMSEAAGQLSKVSLEDRFTWIEYAQHYGVPTRLLDWTGNPLVALYFACCSLDDKDGKVYLLRRSHYHQITQTSNFPVLKQKTIKEVVADTIWKNTDCFPYPVVFRPYAIDQRMKAQSSWFMVWGADMRPLTQIINEVEKAEQGKALYNESYATGVTALVEKHETALLHIRIPAENKLQILRDLDTMNINQGTLFPSLDGIGRTVEWRKRLQLKDMDNWF